MTAATAPSADRLAAWRERLDTRFEQVDPVFEPLATQAAAQLRAADFDAWLDAARALGKLGRGVEPMLVFLEEWPAVVQALGGDAGALPALMQAVEQLQKSPNGRAIAPLLQSLAAVARRLPGREPLQDWFDLCVDLMRRTSVSIHGHHTTMESPGLPAFLGAAPRLLDALAIDGLRRWVDYGVRNHGSHPQRQVEYFSLASSDSRAVLQRERHGTLFADVQRRLELTLRALWGETGLLVPYSTAFDELRQPVPYFDALGLRVPDVMDDLGGVSGLERYRAVLAHGVSAEVNSSMLAPAMKPASLPERITSAVGGWRSSSSKTPAWTCSSVAASRVCAASCWRCTRARARTPVTTPPPPACATGWPCCRSLCSTRPTATRTRCCSTA